MTISLTRLATTRSRSRLQLMKIDSHQHFWIVGKFDYPWMSPSLGVLYRDYLPSDLKPILKSAGIDKTIVVQASPSVVETDWLLELAGQHDFIAGVVGWLDLEDEHFPKQLERYRCNRKFIGIRPAVEFIPDDTWLIKPRVLKSLSLIAETGFPMDLIVWPRHLSSVVEMLRKLPNLRCVVDHLAKPDVKEHKLEPWRQQIAEIAQNKNAFCKLSGILTMADHKNWMVEDIQPYVDHVLA